MRYILLAAERRICVEQPFRAMRVQRPYCPRAPKGPNRRRTNRTWRVRRGKEQRRDQLPFAATSSCTLRIARWGSSRLQIRPCKS